ncbi:hypothetical protein OB919_16795 [Halobacteria archaeon AArc-curdl1]|uniref:Uncharacterized protein n=1 Tax=Natronosalvus hydrolyticus TaxID=2979988 RepID=A0AAP3E8W3_9EURY|nr:hypothetical protein [Halobacteria archaeon AArc-curdl1]
MTPVTRARETIAAVKNPTYTGENRCVPCTILNLVIAGGLSAGIGFVVAGSSRGFALGAAVGTFGLAVTVIYFHGFLVPGTPWFTKRYFPDRVLALFDKAPDYATAGTTDPQDVLLEIGVVVDDPSVGDLVLDPAFEHAWVRSIARHRSSERMLRATLGQLAGIAPDALEFEESPYSFVAWADGERVANWPSRAACIADVAAVDSVTEWDPTWAERSLPFKADLLGVLRLFLETCPTCDGTVTLSQDVVESCCRRRDVVAATCLDCNARLFEMDVDLTDLDEQ